VWADSHARIRAWGPRILCPTHFGPARPVDEHIDEHEARLARWSERVAADLAAGDDPAEAAARFAATVREEIRDCLGSGEASTYTAGGGATDSWHGLARYHRKHSPDPD